MVKQTSSQLMNEQAIQSEGKPPGISKKNW